LTKSEDRLPWFPLALLAAIGLVLVALETMPTGLLPDIATGMHVTEGTVGLFLSAYAIGTVLVTVPAITLTRSFRRKPLLLCAVALPVLANTVTALSPAVSLLSLLSRFVAGSMSGIVWGLFATYARRISPRSRPTQRDVTRLTASTRGQAPIRTHSSSVLRRYLVS
jgi:predicted MFS family arabinose efflux permease